jgi:hypothetical protein
MSRRNVLDAICCVLPMTGMITGQLGLRAMQLADRAAENEGSGPWPLSTD